MLKQFGSDFKYLDNKLKPAFSDHGFIVQMRTYTGKLSMTGNTFQRTRLQYSDICSYNVNGNAVITHPRSDPAWTRATTTPANVLLDSTTGSRTEL